MQDELQRHRVANRELYNALIAASTSASASADSLLVNASSVRPHTPPRARARSPTYSSLLNQDSADRQPPRRFGHEAASPPRMHGFTPRPPAHGSSPPPRGRFLNSSPSPSAAKSTSRIELALPSSSVDTDTMARTGVKPGSLSGSVKLLPEPSDWVRAQRFGLSSAVFPAL